MILFEYVSQVTIVSEPFQTWCFSRTFHILVIVSCTITKINYIFPIRRDNLIPTQFVISALKKTITKPFKTGL